MATKKTLKFDLDDEKHSDFQKVRVVPTKVFHIEGVEDEDIYGYSLLSTKDLKYKLSYESLNDDQIRIIKKIIKYRELES